MALEKLFEKYCTEKTYLHNISPATLRFYRGSWSVIQKYLPVKEAGELTKDVLNELVIALRKAKQSPKSVNTHISFLNAFLTWLYEEKHTTEHLKIKKLRLEQTIFKVFKEDHIRVILRFQPNGYYERRLWTSLCLLLDTGMRISELLNLRDEDVKFDQQIIIVKGKGRKERFIPFSTEMRKILWRFYKQKRGLQINGGIFFATTAGTVVSQRNFLRDMKIFCKRLGIEGVRISPHTIRHSYAIWYLTKGGDLYTLARTLGHSSIAVTQIYLRSMGIEQVQEAHQRFSPLARK